MQKYLCSEAALQRCSPRKTLYKYKTNAQENNRTEVQSQQSRFATLLKSHPRTDVPPRIQSTPAEHLSLREHLWETALVCQNSFKRYKLLKVIIYSS